MSRKEAEYDKDISNSHAHRQAAAKGLRVQAPAADELQLDIDSFHQMAVFGRNRILLEWYVPIKKVTIAPSASGEDGHFHIRVFLGREVKGSLERIALQAILGSDPVRELFSYARFLNGDTQPTLFFEKKTTSELIDDELEDF